MRMQSTWLSKPLPRALFARAGEVKTPKTSRVRVIGSVHCSLRADPITLTLCASVGSLRDPTALIRFAAQPRYTGEV